MGQFLPRKEWWGPAETRVPGTKASCANTVSKPNRVSLIRRFLSSLLAAAVGKEQLPATHMCGVLAADETMHSVLSGTDLLFPGMLGEKTAGVSQASSQEISEEF